MAAPGGGGDPIARWLAAPVGARLADFWGEPGESLPDAFARFYAAILRHIRVNPGEALAALRRIGTGERRRLRPRDRRNLVRLRAHTLATAGELRRAVAEYERAWKAEPDPGDPRELVATGIGWVGALAHLSRYGEAHRLALRCRSLVPRGRRSLRARLDTNHGVALQLAGRFEAAAERYRAARRAFRAEGLEADAAFATHNLGHCLLGQARVGAARRCFEEAAGVFRDRGLTALELGSRAALAFTSLVEGGEPEDHLRELQEIRDALESLGSPRQAALIRRRQAEFLGAIGALEQAEVLAARSFRDYERLGLRSDAAQAAFLHARILIGMDRRIDARIRLARARAIWGESGDRRSLRRAEVELAALHLTRSESDVALRHLRTATPYLVRHDPHGGGVRALHVLAEARLGAGRPALAARAARAAWAAARRFPGRWERPGIAMTLARALAASGDERGGVRWARRSIAEVERAALTLGTQALRGQFSASQDRIHRDAIRLVLSMKRGDAARIALDLLSRIRSPQLIEDLLREGPALGAALRSTIARLRDEVLSTGERPGGDVRARSLHERIHHLDDKLGRVLANPPSIVARARRATAFAAWAPLLAGRSLVFYDTRPECCAAFVVGPDLDVRWVPLPRAEAALDDSWVPLRLLLEHAAHLGAARRERFLAETLDEAEAALLDLRRALWEPLEVEGGEILAVLGGALHGVPIECLAPGECVARWPHPALITTPTATRPTAALLLDDGGRATRAEAAAVSRILRRQGHRVRRARSVSDLRRRSSPLGVLHVAAHGSFHRSRWVLNGLRLRDGWLGFEQLRPLGARDALFFFSSCESGRRAELPGSELDGWMSAGLGAGAREMVLALWKIDDAVARDFAAEFYPLWCRGTAAPRAAAIARSRLRERRPHPYAWAPFVAVG